MIKEDDFSIIPLWQKYYRNVNISIHRDKNIEIFANGIDLEEVNQGLIKTKKNYIISFIPFTILSLIIIILSIIVGNTVYILIAFLILTLPALVRLIGYVDLKNTRKKLLLILENQNQTFAITFNYVIPEEFVDKNLDFNSDLDSSSQQNFILLTTTYEKNKDPVKYDWDLSDYDGYVKTKDGAKFNRYGEEHPNKFTISLKQDISFSFGKSETITLSYDLYNAFNPFIPYNFVIFIKNSKLLQDELNIVI